MLLYGTVLTPLVELLQNNYPDILQPWYADDAVFISPAKRNAQLLNQITKYGPDFGYYSEPAKSWHICTAPLHFAKERLNIQFTQGHHYVVGFIGSRSMKQTWLQSTIQQLVTNVEVLSKVAVKCS